MADAARPDGPRARLLALARRGGSTLRHNRVAQIAVAMIVVQLGYRIWATSLSWYTFDDFAFMSRAYTDGIKPSVLIEPYAGHVMPAGMFLSWVSDHDRAVQLPDHRRHADHDAGARQRRPVRPAGALVRTAARHPATTRALSLLRHLVPGGRSGGPPGSTSCRCRWCSSGHYRRTSATCGPAGCGTCGSSCLAGPSGCCSSRRPCWCSARSGSSPWPGSRRALCVSGSATPVERLPDRLRGVRRRRRVVPARLLQLRAQLRPEATGQDGLADVFSNMVFHAYLPSLLGGPLTWSALDQFSLPDVGTLVMVASVALVGLVVREISRRRRRGPALWLPTFFLGLNIMLVFTGRASFVGPLIALDFRYQGELAAVTAIALACATMPIRGAVEPVEPPAPVRSSTTPVGWRRRRRRRGAGDDLVHRSTSTTGARRCRRSRTSPA